MLQHLHESSANAKNFEQIVVGVITNSDPRVPEVLSSLGLSISPLRYGSPAPEQPNTRQRYDVNFSVMSYDVGHEKPNVQIFRAAEDMLDPALKARGDTSTSRDPNAWEKIYVGDEYNKDVVGARNAKWDAILISEEPVDDDETGVKWLEDEPVGSLMRLLQTKYDAVAFGSLFRIVDWLQL